jgi:hypothetical protein
MTGIVPSTPYNEEKKLFICSCHAHQVSECKLLSFLLCSEESDRHYSQSAAATGNKRGTEQQVQPHLPGVCHRRRTATKEKRIHQLQPGRKIAAELHGHTLSAWLCFQGEPMMHPRFFDIVDLFGR